MRFGAMSALVVPALLGAVVSHNPRKRVLFLALAVIGLVEQDEEEQEHAAQRQRRRLFGKLFAGPCSTPHRYDRLMRRAAPISAPRK